MKPIYKWLGWWLCILLVVGSVGGYWVAETERADATRGWIDATETLDLPLRLPLVGVNVELTQYAPDELETELAKIEAAGFTWVRQSFWWEQIEPEAGIFEWDTYDAIVAAVDAHVGLQLVAVLDGTPGWARHRLAPDHPYAPPASPEAYGAFAQAVAARYADSITYYQIWDEPNIRLHWGDRDPRPAHYAAMLQAAHTAIHGADAEASVIMAALAPTVETGPENLSELLFLRAVYDQGGGDYFDAAAGKPYGYSLDPYDRRVAENLQNFSRLILLREELVRHGDGDKPIWGSNFGWNHLPEDWNGLPSLWGQVTAEQRAVYTRDAFQRAREEWPWLGGLIVQHWQPDAPADDPIQGFAVVPVIDEWGAQGVLPAVEGLIPGRYPAQNAYTTYSDGWQFSELGADAMIPAEGDADVENHITVQFEGTTFALAVRRDDYLAYLYVTVDGKQANALPQNQQGEAQIILTSPERTPTLDLILVADSLGEGVHTAEIVHRTEHGDDRWPIAGFAVAVPPDTAAYDRAQTACWIVGVLALLAAGLLSLRLPWRALKRPALPTVQHALDWFLSLFAAFVVLVGTLATWSETIPTLLRRDQPALAITIVTAGIASLSPIAIVSLLALGVLFILIFNRPLLGIMLIIFWSAFFLSTLDMLFVVFTTVEVYFGLTVAALIARALFDWARIQRGEPVDTPTFTRLTLNRLDGLVLAFLALAVVSLTWSEFMSPAVRNLRVVVLEPVLFYFLLRVMRLERRDWVWLADTLLFAGGAIAVVGLVLYATGESVVEAEDGARRLISIYGSPNGVGLYLGRCMPFALGFALVSPRGSWRWFYAVASGAVMLVAVLLSQSRGAIMLGIPAAVVIVLLFWYGRRALIPIIAAVIGLGVVMVPLMLVLPRLGDLFGDTFMFRRHLWFSSVELLQERPLRGVGLDQFLYWYRSRYLVPEAWEEPNLSIPHNILLNYWVNLGVLGVVIGVMFQAFFWQTLWRVRAKVAETDPLGLALVLGLAGSMGYLLAHGLVDVGYFAINLAFVFFLFFAMLQYLSASAELLDQSGV